MKALRLSLLMMGIGSAFLAGYGFRSASAQQRPDTGQSTGNLPADIYPESLCRLPRPRREDLTTDAEKQAFDRLVALTPQVLVPKGSLGATGIRMQIPELAEGYRNLFMLLREKGGLEPKYFTLAVLVAARESDDEYEWSEYEPNAVKLLSRDLVEMIRNKQEIKGAGEKEEALIRLGREMHRGPKVTSKTYSDMERLFGRKQTLDIVLIIGFYEGSGLMFRAYDHRLPPEKKRPFPDVVAMESK